MSDEPPHERLTRWDDDETHYVRVSRRMLEEFLKYGQTTTAGTSLVGPELLVLEYHDPDRRGVMNIEDLSAMESETPDSSGTAIDHTKWSGGFICHVQDAGFEPQEMERNGGDCPWCGRAVDTEGGR